MEIAVENDVNILEERSSETNNVSVSSSQDLEDGGVSSSSSVCDEGYIALWADAILAAIIEAEVERVKLR